MKSVTNLHRDELRTIKIDGHAYRGDMAFTIRLSPGTADFGERV